MRKPPRSLAGFSLVEGLVVVTVIGLMAAVLIPAISGAPDAAKKAKLEQDVVIVNNAIDTYLVAGGSQAGLSSSGVIETLKQKIYGGVAAEMIGPQGPFLDPTVVTRPTDFAWSARFEASPRPRFVVQNSRDGVVFARGPASVVAGPAAGSKPSWLWSYAAPGAGPASKPIFEPETIEGVTHLGISSSILAGLAAPVISPASQTLTISGFPLLVNIVNPNPAGSSLVYYKINSGSYTLWVNSPFNVDPGSTVIAVAVSIDPSRYYNSPASTATYQVTPLTLAVNVSAPSTVTYAQAGGVMLNQPAQAVSAATISLGVSVPAPYLSSANFAVRYTTDGSDPLSSGTASNAPAFNTSFPALSVGLGLAAWGTNSSLTIRAAAVALNTAWFASSPIASGTVVISPTALASPSILPASGRYFNSIPVVINAPTTNVPAGSTVFFTTNGTVPANGTGTSFVSSTSFNLGPVGYGQSGTVRAITVGLTNLLRWFTPSSVTSVVYSGPNFNYAGVSGGVLIAGGTIGNNASLRGSVIIASATSGAQPNLTFNNNSGLTGDIYVPGTPIVTGVASNKVINLDGDINPTNYTVSIGSGVVFGGSVYRRITPVPLPTVTLPTGLVERGNASSGTLQPGHYGTVNPNNNATITLGVAGATQPSVYSFDTLAVGNGAKVNIVGPVVLTLNPGSTSTISIQNNVVVGNSLHPEWLQIKMYTGNLNLGNNGTLYGSVLAPQGTVTFENNSVFNGSVTAKTFLLNNNGAGITFSLPPPQ